MQVQLHKTPLITQKSRLRRKTATIATHKPTMKPPPTSDKSTPKPPLTTHKPSLKTPPTTHKPWHKSPPAHLEPPSTTQITTKPSPTTQNFRSDSQKKEPTNPDPSKPSWTQHPPSLSLNPDPKRKLKK